MKPFVDFYRNNAISPVAQDISDLQRHMSRRDALYRHLGLVPSWLRGRSVIEFGPGSGHNALHTASLGPRRYQLVDGNPTGLDRARQLLQGASGVDFTFTEALVEEFDTDEKFDLVICEGTIPFQMAPQSFLRSIARFAAPGGVVITTCVDGVSLLAETLRRLAAAFLIRPEQSTAEKVRILLPVFSPHLSTLKGMSRSHEDWVLDQLVQPLVGRLFSIEDAIAALDDGFDVHGTSPKFLTDWRWYKDIHGADQAYNRVALESYWRGVHNFLDYRETFDPRAIADNRRLLATADGLYYRAQRYWLERDLTVLDDLKTDLQAISSECSTFAPRATVALRDFQRVFGAWRSTGAIEPFSDFAACFGRGQQYLSFIRR